MTSITVLIPVYKSEAYLPFALQSLADQTLQPQRVIVVDDGPEPAVDAVVADWKDKLNIKLVKHPENLGLFQARKTALEHCDTEYCINLDSDDTMHPDAVQSLSDCAAELDADVICVGRKYISVDGEVTQALEPHSTEVVTFDKDEVFRNQFSSAGPEYKYANLSIVGGKLIRAKIQRTAYDELGDDVPHITFNEDTLLMFMVLAQAKTICQIPRDFYEYRKRTTSVTYPVGVDHALKFLEDATWGMDRMEDYARRHMNSDVEVTKMLYHNRRYIKQAAITQRLGRTQWTPEELEELYRTLPDVLREALYSTELSLQTASLKKRRYRLQDEATKADVLIRSLKYRNRNLQAKLDKIKGALEE